MKRVILIGAGGYFSAVVDSIKTSTEYEIVGVTDPVVKGLQSGVKVIGDDSVLEKVYNDGVKYAFVTVGGVGDYTLRNRLINLACDIGFSFVNVIDKTASIAENVTLGQMVYVGKNAAINPGVTVGDFSIINTAAVVEHGCKIGSYCHIAPAAALAGDITIENHVHIGINATLLQGISIGEGSIVGAGSTVLHNVLPGKKVYGVV
ncbi:MAG: NeuD/PglB/VioB family sugar acetyltransferase [Lachnospiraceae bacterium]|nr:NeuD/PglB/VioB family sugar acetyltransferase [Lachnospiraceae bacterium]